MFLIKQEKREAIKRGGTTDSELCNLGRGIPASASRVSLAALTSPTTPTSGATSGIDESIYEPWEMTEHERELCAKCVQLIQLHIPSKPPPIPLKVRYPS